ncbi:MAG: alkaline phosphatase family protein [Candidatus Lambdaproteobacteria bacterium]|nr:alkaline phosphatase family protein [Candidatus Lambdaproteobacteria bacterium]
MSTPPEFLIVVFDGLRPDLITPGLMPNLARFQAGGSAFPLSRAVFPSATRVNATALVTGAVPGVHGIVANKFFDPRVFPDRAIDTAQHTELEAAEQAWGRLVTAPSLGELLAEAGQRMAVVSSGSGGTARLLNPRAQALEHVTLCLRAWGASTPAGFAEEMLRAFGPIPPAGRPNAARLTRQTDLFLESVHPRVQPAVSVVWFSDPDSTFHECGIGSAEGLACLRHADGEFGRLLEWAGRREQRERLQVLALSDHGHITARRRIEIKRLFAEAGLRFDSHFRADVEFAGSAGYTGAIRVRGGERARMGRLVAWLAAQPWCGLIFTAGGDGIEGAIPGTFDRALLMLDHERAPEVYFVMENDHARDANGIEGGCFFEGEYPEGGSTHGGLHPKELHNVLIAQGSRFRPAYRSPFPAGITDVAPTLLQLLGLPIPPTMTGRVLSEALREGAGEPPPPEHVEHTVGTPPRRQHLHRSRVGRTTYLNAGWVE